MIIGIIGRTNSGKDTLAETIQRVYMKSNQFGDWSMLWEIVKLSKTTKEIVGSILGITPVFLEEKHVKSSKIKDLQYLLKKTFPKVEQETEEFPSSTALSIIPSDLNTLGEITVKQLLNDVYKKLEEYNSSLLILESLRNIKGPKNVIIPDLRDKEKAYLLKSMGAVLIRLTSERELYYDFEDNLVDIPADIILDISCSKEKLFKIVEELGMYQHFYYEKVIKSNSIIKMSFKEDKIIKRIIKKS